MLTSREGALFSIFHFRLPIPFPTGREMPLEALLPLCGKACPAMAGAGKGVRPVWRLILIKIRDY